MQFLTVPKMANSKVGYEYILLKRVKLCLFVKSEEQVKIRITHIKTNLLPLVALVKNRIIALIECSNGPLIKDFFVITLFLG